MNKYIILKNKHEKIANEFPQFFAFDNEQLEKGLKKLNATKKDILSIGFGGFIKKTDLENYKKMWEQINEEFKEAMKEEDFLFEGFRYELSNHEYVITYDYEDTLSCFNLKYEELTKAQLNILRKATKEYLKNCEMY